MAMTTTAILRADIATAIDAEEPLDEEQLVELLRYEAALLGMSVDLAIAKAKDGTLPKDAIGFGIESMIRMLE